MVSKNNPSINSTALTVAVLIFATLYAVIRYNIYSEVPWNEFPLYVLNKIISFSAIILLSFTIIFRKRENPSFCKKVLKYSKALILIHVLVSLIIFSSSYYPKLFEADKVNLIGQFTILAGIASLFQLNNLRYYKLSRIEKSISILKRNGSEFLLIVLSLHLIIMGFSGWIKTHNWPGGLPPISLLSFIVVLIPFFIKRRT